MAKTVLVVGAGIIGASVAWHLARAGCKVTIVDADVPGGVATPHSFAWINASWGNPEFYFHFRRRSMAGWRRIERDVPAVAVNWCGGLMWDPPPEGLAAFAEEYGRWGYGIRMIDRAEALSIEPGLTHPPDLAVHVAEEGMLEPIATTQALVAAALAESARLLPATHIMSLATSSARVYGVVTDSGDILEADETVVAAGVDTARLLRSAGIHLALDTPAGLIAHSTRSARKLLNGLVMAPDLHIRQTREGRLIAGADFAGADPQGREREMGLDLIARVKAMISGADDLELDFTTVGNRPTPSDGFPAIGRPNGTPGLYVAVLHSGVTLAPIVGELAALEISTGRRDPDLAPYNSDRAALVSS